MLNQLVQQKYAISNDLKVNFSKNRIPRFQAKSLAHFPTRCAYQHGQHLKSLSPINSSAVAQLVECLNILQGALITTKPPRICNGHQIVTMMRIAFAFLFVRMNFSFIIMNWRDLYMVQTLFVFYRSGTFQYDGFVVCDFIL